MGSLLAAERDVYKRQMDDGAQAEQLAGECGCRRDTAAFCDKAQRIHGEHDLHTRQLVLHRHFTVNGQTVNIPSYLCLLYTSRCV